MKNTKNKNLIINEIIDQEQDLLYEIGPYTKRLFRTNYNSQFLPKKFENTDEPSMTVPGQSYTIKEILERFANGQSLSIQKAGSFTENPDFDDITLNPSTIQDLTDLDEVQTLNQDKIRTLSAELDVKKAKPNVNASTTKNEEAESTTPGEAFSPSGSEQLRNT